MAEDPKRFTAPAVSSRDRTVSIAGDVVATPGSPSATSSDSTADELPAGTAIGRYVVLSAVGAGAGGTVYAARDTTLGRKVALKLVRDPLRVSAKIRLAREAQALAKLSHANVVAVYNAGSYRDQVYLAMELVEGTTLRQWLRGTERSWREVLDVMLEAGEGLRAAHQAGLTHRDFKPENVLIDGEGRVRVGDFGLAMIDSEEPEHVETEPGSSRPSDLPAAPGFGGPLTRTGMAVGTPAYMSPEQWSGWLPVDARSDQFSYCVSLYEALYHERPFGDESATDLEARVSEGRILEPHGDHRVPSWLRRVVVRGLAYDPDERHPSMEALLGSLRRVRRWPRRVAIAAGALVLVGASALAARALWTDDAGPCRAAADRLAGVWDGARKQSVRAALRATGSPLADRAYAGVERALDARAAEWIAMHTDSCEATQVRGEQSEVVLDLRTECLDRRRSELRALTDAFLRADARTVESAVEATSSLPPVASCADIGGLREEVAPASPAQRAAIGALRERLAALNASVATGQLREVVEPARVLAADAREVGYRPLEAEVLLALANVQRQVGDAPGAEKSLYQAIAAAEAGRSASLKATAWLDLSWLVGVVTARYNEAAQLLGVARAAIERGGGGDRSAAKLEVVLGVLESAQGRPAAARPHLERAVELTGRFAGPRDFAMIQPLHNLAIVAQLEGKTEESLELHRRVRAIISRELGDEHPAMLSAINSEATVFDAAGRTDEAMASYRKGLALMEKLDLLETENGASFLHNMAATQAESGDHAAAIASYTRALAIQDRIYRHPHPNQAATHFAIGESMRQVGRSAEAIRHYERTIEISSTPGLPPTDLVDSLNGIAETHLGDGHPERALAPVERALAMVGKDPDGDPMTAAETRALAARVLDANHREASRARDLARQAIDGFTRTEDTERAGEMTRWLESRGASGTPGASRSAPKPSARGAPGPRP